MIFNYLTNILTNDIILSLYSFHFIFFSAYYDWNVSNKTTIHQDHHFQLSAKYFFPSTYKKNPYNILLSNRILIISITHIYLFSI